MSDKYFWVTIIGMIVSFAGGFLLANSLNRNEISALQSQVEQAKKNPAPTSQTMPGSTNQAEPQLSDAEIKQKIAEEDSAPENTNVQRDLGAAL